MILGKYKSLHRTTKIAIFIALASTLFITLGQILWKFGTLGEAGILALINFHFFLGCVSYAFATILLIKALSKGELSVIYPVTAMSFIWVTLSAPLIFPTDTITSLKWVGVIAILLGVSFIGFGSDVT